MLAESAPKLEVNHVPEGPLACGLITLPGQFHPTICHSFSRDGFHFLDSGSFENRLGLECPLPVYLVYWCVDGFAEHKSSTHSNLVKAADGGGEGLI